MKRKSLTAKKTTHRLILNHLNNQKILKIYNEFKKSLNTNKKFAVAISGGPDSLSLAFLSKCFSLINNIEIKYYLVDHKLRDSSTKEAILVALKLKKFDIDCKILTWKGKKPSTNIQALARKKRYSLLTNACKKDKIEKLLLGHHNDDLLENFLIRLLRGSGLKGLTSFGKESEYRKNDIQLLRPLINLDKEELINLSKKVFNFFINDPSNLNEYFKRVKIRKLMNNLKKEGLDKRKLELTINNLKDSNKSINYYFKRNIDQNAKFFKDKNIFVLNKNFFKQPHEIVFRSLSFLIKNLSNKYYPARGKSIKELILKIQSKSFKKSSLGGCLIEKTSETILISRENYSKR